MVLDYDALEVFVPLGGMEDFWTIEGPPSGFGFLPDAICGKARPVGEAATSPSLTKPLAPYLPR